MKKIFSILTVTILFATMLDFSVARHYCGGELAGSKISLSGSLASCGMENNDEDCPINPSGKQLKSHCCDDVVTYYSLDNNYTQIQTVIPVAHSVVKFVPEITLPDNTLLSDNTTGYSAGVSPPGSLKYSSVDLTAICVFRI